jgi:putative ABC transport system permease protein
MLRDLFDVLRGLRRTPGFTFVVVSVLAVGIGGTVATLSVADRVLFRPPEGLRDPAQVRRLFVQERFRNFPTVTTGLLSYPDFQDLATAAPGRGVLASYATMRDQVLGGSESLVAVTFVSRDYFLLVGVRPLRGRFFTAEETENIPPAINPVVLSAGLWRREFGADTSLLGRVVSIRGVPFTIVGIAASGFVGLDLEPSDVWAPMGSLAPMAVGGEGGRGSLHNRGVRGFSAIARLENGRWPELAERLTAQYRESQRSEVLPDSAARVIVTPLLDVWDPRLGYYPRLGIRNASLALRLVFVALAVLVVSILNGAVMLALRSVQRRRETSIRLALGMPRAQLIHRSVIESLCIATLAGGFAVVFGWWGARTLDASVHSTLPPADGAINSRLLVAVMLATGVVLVATAALPAIASWRISPAALRSDDLAAGAADSRLRVSLVAAQTAACVALVMLAGLSIHSLNRIATADFGFDTDRLVQVDAPPGENARDLHAAIQRLPEVESATLAASVLAGGEAWAFAIPDKGAIPDSLAPGARIVGQDYLRTAGARVLAGRGFREQDFAGAQHVVVITRTMADRFWPGESPLGRCVLVLGDFSTCRYVIGVVQDFRWDISRPPRAQFFALDAQTGSRGGRFVLIRTRVPASAADVAAIERAARSAYNDRLGAGQRPRAMRVSDALEQQLAPLRAASTLFLVFGVLALVSAAGGVFGLISAEISRRTREIGVRMALGAAATDIALVVARWVATPFAIGLVVGSAGALAGGRLVAAYLFETAAYDAAVFGAVIAVVVLTALAGALAPARRAATLDPAAALRAL